jgi:hypothetical protein
LTGVVWEKAAAENKKAAKNIGKIVIFIGYVTKLLQNCYN